MASSPTSIFLVVGVLFGLLLAFAFAQQNTFLLLAALLVSVLVWMKGFLRFPHARALAVGTWKAAVRLVTKRRITKRSLRNLGITVAVVVVLVGTNSLGLRGPGRAHGVSIPTQAFSLNFGGIGSEGGTFAAIVSYLLILVPIGLVWWRFAHGLDRRDTRLLTYFVCLVAFALAPLVFALDMAIVAPQSTGVEVAKANARFAAVAVRFALATMAIAFCAAATLTHLVPEEEGPRPQRALPTQNNPARHA